MFDRRPIEAACLLAATPFFAAALLTMEGFTAKSVNAVSVANAEVAEPLAAKISAGGEAVSEPATTAAAPVFTALFSVD